MGGYLTFSLFLLVFLVAGAVQAVPHEEPAAVDISTVVDSNKLSMYVTNLGVFAYDLTGSGIGLEFPIGSGKGLVFAAGLWVAARVDNETLVALGIYSPEFSPGPIDEFGRYPDPADPVHRVYKITRGDTASADYLEWPADLGAPTDSAGDPLLTGEQTLWCVYNDANPDRHVALEGGTDPLGIEVRETAYAFGPPVGRGNAVFLEFEIINKLDNTLDSAYVAIWCDADLGGSGDDLAGCDTVLDVGFAYNGFDYDDVYGDSPPCLGIDLLEGVMGDNGERLPMTAFRRYENGFDPINPAEVYNMMKGLSTAGDPIIDPSTGEPTTYDVPGDPVTGAQWLDASPGDRRFLLSAGPFTLEPGDTNDLAVAVIAARGGRLVSISNMKLFARLAQAYFDSRKDGLRMGEFSIVEEAGLLRLDWTSPARRDIAGVLIRYSTEKYPESSLYGIAVPGGDNGYFPGRPGASGSFIHAGIEPGVVHYYSAFAVGAGASPSLFGLGHADPGESAGIPVPDAGAGGGPLFIGAVPNPTRGTTAIRYSGASDVQTELAVFNISGRLVRTLAVGELNGDPSEVTWDGRDEGGRQAAPGIYFIRVSAGGASSTGKVVLLK